MSPKYLTTKIAESKRTLNHIPRYGMIRLEGEKVWRRVMVWQFSNSGTCARHTLCATSAEERLIQGGGKKIHHSQSTGL